MIYMYDMRKRDISRGRNRINLELVVPVSFSFYIFLERFIPTAQLTEFFLIKKTNNCDNLLIAYQFYENDEAANEINGVLRFHD